MSFAFQILSHAIRMVFRDLPATFRATYFGVMFILAGSLVFVFLVHTLEPTQESWAKAIEAGEWYFLGPIMVQILHFIGFLMMVIAWHRFVLLPQARRAEGFTPDAVTVMRYIGNALIIGFCILILAIPITVFPYALAKITQNYVLIAVLSLPLMAALIWVTTRISMVLPACSIGNTMNVSESWAATAQLSKAIFVLAVLMVVLEFVVNIVSGAVLPASDTVTLLSTVVSVFYALISASVLTTLYGIAVEERDLRA